MAVCPEGHWYMRGSYCRPCADQLVKRAALDAFDAADTIPDGVGRFYVQHEPGCGRQPRNPRGCHCGRDHQ